MGFAGACLAIGQEGRVVTFEDGLNEMCAAFVEFLLRPGVEDVVEAE
jgi:hypothetical protein